MAKINGKTLDSVAAIKEANAIGGRHGLGIKHALENRIIGTKSRGVYEAPGMELLGRALEYLYHAVLDRRSAVFFKYCSDHISNQCYDGRMFDPSTQAAQAAIRELTSRANGTVKVSLYKGNLFFVSLTELTNSLYNEEDSSMEASDGLNPISSQGYAEIQAVEARSMSLAGFINEKCK
jgi:argininosuccinate synthase